MTPIQPLMVQTERSPPRENDPSSQSLSSNHITRIPSHQRLVAAKDLWPWASQPGWEMSSYCFACSKFWGIPNDITGSLACLGTAHRLGNRTCGWLPHFPLVLYHRAQNTVATTPKFSENWPELRVVVPGHAGVPECSLRYCTLWRDYRSADPR